MLEHRQLTRRKFSYYLLAFDDRTGELIGHWTDISLGGFQLETIKPIPKDTDFRFRINLSGDISGKSTMIFNARSRWCQQVPLDPNLFVVGFQIASLSLDDSRIFARMFERYGSQAGGRNYMNDYLWK